MPSVLGKRKARPSEEESAAARAKALAVFQQHFESQFKLPGELAASKSRISGDDVARAEDEDEDDDETETDESDSEWGGVSDDGDVDGDDELSSVTIVDHSKSNLTSEPVMTKQETKKYMSSRPPTDDPSSTRNTKAKNSTGANGVDEDSAAFLAKDLELQRLISESHILSAAGGNPAYYTSARGGPASSAKPDELFTAGRVRKVTTDMRLRALGAKGSILAEGKMPMAKRKGLVAAKVEREDRRRREARENGIILEKPAAKNKREPPRKRSERPVDLPGVGKMRGAELRISARDMRSIADSARPAVGGKGRRGRRR